MSNDQPKANAESMPHKDSFIPVVDGLLLTMPQGGPIQYRSQSEAEVHARQYKRGYVGGAVPRPVDEVL